MTLPTLQELWDSHTGRLIDKWDFYLPLYTRYFERFRCFDRGLFPIVLEIGVCHGGSLQLWKKFFGTSIILGVDIDPRCKEYEEEGIQIFTMDQTDPRIADIHIGQFDIIIDDGSHNIDDQQETIRLLWPKLRDRGVYFIEDCHQFLPTPPLDSGSVGIYPWVLVFEKMNNFHPHRIVTGKPSRPLNYNEIFAYGKIDAKYRE